MTNECSNQSLEQMTEYSVPANAKDNIKEC